MQLFKKSKRITAMLLTVTTVMVILGGISVSAAGWGGGNGKGNGNGNGNGNGCGNGNGWGCQIPNQDQNPNQNQGQCLLGDCKAYSGEWCDPQNNNCTCPYSGSGCIRQGTGNPQEQNPDCPYYPQGNANSNNNGSNSTQNNKQSNSNTPTTFNQSNPICPDCGDRLFIGSSRRSGAARRNVNINCTNPFNCDEHLNNVRCSVTYRSSNCPYFYETETTLIERYCRRY